MTPPSAGAKTVGRTILKLPCEDSGGEGPGGFSLSSKALLIWSLMMSIVTYVSCVGRGGAGGLESLLGSGGFPVAGDGCCSTAVVAGAPCTRVPSLDLLVTTGGPGRCAAGIRPMFGAMAVDGSGLVNSKGALGGARGCMKAVCLVASHGGEASPVIKGAAILDRMVASPWRGWFLVS